MKVSIAEVGWKEKPNRNDVDWGDYLDSFCATEMEPIDLADHILKGNGFTNVFDGRPRTESFVMGQVIAVDLDDGPLCSLPALLKHPFVLAYASFIYPTFSSTADAPRHRVVFCLDEPILGADAFAYASKMVYRLFPGADVQCSNPARTFMGNGSAGIMDCWFGANLLPVKELRVYAMQQLREEKTKTKREEPLGLEPNKLVSWATTQAKAGERNNIGFWLACRLKEEGQPLTQALDWIDRYQQEVEGLGPEPYTKAEARSSVYSAYSGGR